MMTKKKEKMDAEERYYIASQWQLMWRKFIKHKLALFGGAILALFYIAAIFCEFFSTQNIYTQNLKYMYCPPQRIHFFDKEGFHLRPFIYAIRRESDPKSLRRLYFEDKTKKHSIFFCS